MIGTILFDTILARATAAGRIVGRPDPIEAGIRLGAVSVAQLLAQMISDSVAIARVNMSAVQTHIRTLQQEIVNDDTYI